MRPCGFTLSHCTQVYSGTVQHLPALQPRDTAGTQQMPASLPRFPSSSKYNRKIELWRTLIISRRLFLSIPFMAFLCHYMGTQNTPINSISLAQNNSNFACSIYIHTYILWGKKEKIHPNINSYTVTRQLTMDIRSEKCISRWFCHCTDIAECTHTNPNGTAFHTPRIHGIVYFS